MEVEEEVLKKANELFDGPEMIIDLYDFTIVWVSDSVKKVTGFTEEDFLGRSIIEKFASTEKDKRKKAMEHLSKDHGFIDVDLKRKGGGLVKFHVEFYTVNIKNGFYHIGKSLKREIISPGK